MSSNAFGPRTIRLTPPSEDPAPESRHGRSRRSRREPRRPIFRRDRSQHDEQVPWNLDRGPGSGEMGYLPGLDGIRAIAVLGVLLYHADVTWLKGGFLGVDVFFVLSGFLITSLILEEFGRSGRIDFKQFYLRRARRLLPALFVVLGATAILAAFVARDAAGQVKTDIVASLFYVTNWWYIVVDQSYFEAMGRPALLQHLWSLAVEEQFYLIWPLMALGLVRWRGRRGVGTVAILVALLSSAWMIVLSMRNGYPANDPSRAYFGTDTHSMGLLLGAALATAWRPGRMRRTLSGGAAFLLTLVGVAALGGIAWFYLRVGEYSTFLYRGGFLVLSALVVVLIAAATHPASPLGRVLGVQPLRYIGQRSYGLYLWHWPIFMVLRPGIDTPLDGIANIAVQLALTFGLAELSYRYVEIPIRRGAIGRMLERWRASSAPQRATYRARAIVVGGAAVAVTALVGAGLATAPSSDNPSELAADVAEAIGIADGGPTAVLIGGSSGAPTGGAAPSPSPSVSTASPSPSPTVEKKHYPRNANGVLTGIGDSVMLGARVTLQRVIKGTQIDAEVSRQAWTVLDRVKALKADGLLTPTVLIHTGTNGTVEEDELRGMLEALADRDLVIVMTTSVPRSWEEPNNELINAVVPEYPNAVIADWWGESQGHREYFVSDGVHLTGPGMHRYAAIVKGLMRERFLQ